MKFNEIPSFLMNFWPKRNFYDILANFQGMYCFEQLELLATYSLMVLMQLKISSENSFYVANIWDGNLLLLFILLKKIWLNLWFGTALRKTHMKFPATIWVSAQPMLFATMATLSVSIVLMRLGSFTYSTFGSHHGKSFKLFYKKKTKILHNKASTQLKYWRHWHAKGYWWAFPVLQASLESCVSLSLVLWQIYLDQEDLKSCLWKWTVYVGTVQNKYWQKMPEFTQK